MEKNVLLKLGARFSLFVSTFFLLSCGGETDNTRVIHTGTVEAPAPPSSENSIFLGDRQNYTIIKTDKGYLVTDNVDNGGTRFLIGVNKLHFADVILDLTVADKAKLIASKDLNRILELYVAFFNRVPDAEGVAYWIDQFNAGMSIERMSESFYAAAIYHSATTGYTKEMSNADFVRTIYKNVLGRSGENAPPDADVQYWAGELAKGKATKGTLVGMMLYSAHTFKEDAKWGWVTKLLNNKIEVATYFSVKHGLNYLTPQESILRGGEIARAVTPVDIAAAKNLIGVNDTFFDLQSAGVATVDGKVIDGYLQHASVFWDCNENKIKDQGEIEVYSMGGGMFTIPKSNNSQCKLIAEVKPYSIDEDTGTAVGSSYQMYPLPSDTTKQNGPIHITPLTSLVSLGIASNETVAEALIKETLGTNYASNIDVISLNSQFGAVHQANVNRLVAKLLQSSQSARNTSNATESRKALGVLYQAALSSKTLSAESHLTHSEVTYEMLKADTLNPMNTNTISPDIKIDIDRGAMVFGISASKTATQNKVVTGFAPPSGRSLTDAQLKYLSDLILYDVDVRLATKAGAVMWSNLPYKKLASINGELRKLNFYSENDSEVISIRGRRSQVIKEANGAVDEKLFAELGTTKDAGTAKKIWHGLTFQAKAIFVDDEGNLNGGNVLFLTARMLDVVEGFSKAVTPTYPFGKYVINLHKLGKPGRKLELSEKRKRVFTAMRDLVENADCGVQLNEKANKIEQSTSEHFDGKAYAELVVEITDCVAGALKAKKTSLATAGAKGYIAFSSHKWLEITSAVTDFVENVLDFYESNPLATRVSGVVQIIHAISDTAIKSYEWHEQAAKKATVNQDKHMQDFFTNVDLIFRLHSAEETEWALRNLFVPANSQTAVICTPPMVKLLNTCLQPMPPVTFETVNLKAIVGEATPFTINVVVGQAGGKIPTSARLSIANAQCAEPHLSIYSFVQTCVSNTVGTFDVYVKYKKTDSQTTAISDPFLNLNQLNSEVVVKIGTVTVESKKPTNAPVITSLSTAIEKANIKISVNVRDADSQRLRMLMVDVSGDGGATYPCFQQFPDIPMGTQTVYVRPNLTTACKTLLNDSGKTSFKVRVHAIDDTNLISGYAYSEIGYSNQAPNVSGLSAVQNNDGSVTAAFSLFDPENTLMGIDAYLSNSGATSYNSRSKLSLMGLTSANRYSVTWSKADADKFLIANNTYAVAVDVFDSSSKSTRQISGTFVRSSVEVPNQAPVISGFTISATNTTVSGSFNISDADGDNVKNLRVHIGKVAGASDCMIDVGGVYGSTQTTGAKSFSSSGCASVMSMSGTYYAKVEAKDVKDMSAAVTNYPFTYNPIGVNQAPVISGFTISATNTTVSGSFNISDADGDNVKNLRVHIGKVAGASDCMIDVGGVYGSTQTTGAKSFSSSGCASVMNMSGTYYAKVEAKDVKDMSAAVTNYSFTFTNIISINGKCGVADGVITARAPTANLCLTGNASSVTGSGPWNWSCAGVNGGSTAYCSAPIEKPTTCTGKWGSKTYLVSEIEERFSNTCPVGTTGKVREFHICQASGAWSSTATSDTCRATLSAPSSASVSSGNNGVQITWGAVSGATGYNIYRDNVLLSNVSGGLVSNFMDSKAINGTRYCYSVEAVSAFTTPPTTSPTKAAGCLTYTPSLPPLLAPTNVQATRISTGGIKISWGTVSGAEEYVLTRQNDSKDWSLSSSVSSYEDLSVTPGNSYSYVVRAKRGADLSPESQQANAIAPSLPVNGVCGSSNGIAASRAPTSNLCSAGSTSIVNGSGPWTWSCSGSNGGTNATCSAPLEVTNVGDFSPKFGSRGTTVIVTVSGTGLPNSLALGIPNVSCENRGLINSSTVQQFNCTIPISAPKGGAMVTIKDRPNGAILRQFGPSVGFEIR